jgi:hypothetical protein
MLCEAALWKKGCICQCLSPTNTSRTHCSSTRYLIIYVPISRRTSQWANTIMTSPVTDSLFIRGLTDQRIKRNAFLSVHNIVIITIVLNREADRAIAEVAIRWFLTAKTRVHTRMTWREFRGGRRGNGAQIFRRVWGFSVANHNPPLLHTHLSPPHEVCHSPDHASH